MSAPEAAEVLRCDLCGQRCTDVDGGRSWVHLELTREQPVDDLHWWSADFCTQDHAAAWLQRPLPDPFRGAASGEGSTWGDRLAAAGCLGVVTLLAGLLGLGCWTAVQSLLEWL